MVQKFQMSEKSIFKNVNRSIALMATTMSAVTLMSVQTASATNRVLATPEIEQLLLNRTIKQVDDQYYAYYTSGGQVRALYVNANESGSWRVSNHQICHSWKTWNRGKTTCFHVIQGQQGAYRFQNVNGRDGFNFVLESGNTRGL